MRVCMLHDPRKSKRARVDEFRILWTCHPLLEMFAILVYKGIVIFPICLLNLLHFVILVYSDILKFFCEIICILNFLSVH